MFYHLGFSYLEVFGCKITCFSSIGEDKTISKEGTKDVVDKKSRSKAKRTTVVMKPFLTRGRRASESPKEKQVAQRQQSSESPREKLVTQGSLRPIVMIEDIQSLFEANEPIGTPDRLLPEENSSHIDSKTAPLMYKNPVKSGDDVVTMRIGNQRKKCKIKIEKDLDTDNVNINPIQSSSEREEKSSKQSTVHCTTVQSPKQATIQPTVSP